MDESLLLDKSSRSDTVAASSSMLQDRVVVITKDSQRSGYRMELQPYDIHEMVTMKALSLRYVCCCTSAQLILGLFDS